ncbi:ion channel [Aliikangiella coralliicola]|uniref:Pentapeptide repeat-containing protein n=1 Tax=Aliikangiella coralliicola TaxID=2592383 RepID=A0A545U7R6_9GAMM|nr:ion channel [Aliikangiella coralliicola]TQV85512.1 pentapeptide repeat-containing protein [Aliikangiella coralliicola]
MSTSDEIKSTDFSDDKIWQNPAREPISSIKAQLETRANTRIPMDGFSLARENLSEINLVNRTSKNGFQLINSDLYRANLENAHLFMLDLSGSSLMKANLANANLHYANLEGCNLLGVNLKGARIEHVNWGKQIPQETQAKRAKSRDNQIDLYQQAEEIYRNLRQTAEHQGLFEFAGHFFQKEMVMRRRQLPKYSFKRIISRLVDIFCGYGERPLKVIAFSLIVIVLFATLYFFSGLSFSGESLAFDPSMSFWENIKIYFTALYFSVVTFTTLGYGDLAPIGVARALAALEAFLGSFTLALFVVVFVKKMTR